MNFFAPHRLPKSSSGGILFIVAKLRLLLVYDPSESFPVDAPELTQKHFKGLCAININEFRNALLEVQPTFILALYDFKDHEMQALLGALRYQRRFREVPIIKMPLGTCVDDFLSQLPGPLPPLLERESIIEELLKSLDLNPIEEELIHLFFAKRQESLSLSDIREKFSRTKVLIFDSALRKQIQTLHQKIHSLLGAERFDRYLKELTVRG